MTCPLVGRDSPGVKPAKDGTGAFGNDTCSQAFFYGKIVTLAWLAA
jgi:hypothetical protein